MTIKLNATSLAKLKGVHPDLVKVVLKAAQICPDDMPFRVICGMRTVAEQRVLVRKGASKTMNSRHLTGHAVDIVPIVDGAVSWHWPNYHKLAPVFKQAAKDLNVPLEWGGDWKSFKDGPHWQLPHKAYPKPTQLFEPEAGLAVALDDEPMAPETEHGAAVKSASWGGGGAIVGAGLGAEPVAAVVDGLVSQQYEISSGDITRIVLALGIIGLSVWMAYKAAKG